MTSSSIQVETPPQQTHYDNNDTPAESYKQKPLWFHDQGLSETPTGYGSKLRSTWMIKINNRWHRVYISLWSNIGTAYIVLGGKDLILKDQYFHWKAEQSKKGESHVQS